MGKKYTVCYGTIGVVINEVNILLEDGWELHGTLVHSNGTSYQPMVLPQPVKGKSKPKAMLT